MMDDVLRRLSKPFLYAFEYPHAAALRGSSCERGIEEDESIEFRAPLVDSVFREG